MKKLIKWCTLALATLSLSVFFTACAPSSIDQAKAKMVKAGYDVSNVLYDGYDGCVGGFYASEGLLSEDKLTAYLFETTQYAAEYLTEHGGERAVQKGKWVISGSTDAIEDFLEFELSF